MKIFAFLLFVSFMLFVAAAAEREERAPCVIQKMCSDNHGHCLKKTRARECTGTLYNKGCKGEECTCCIKDTSICIPKPHCGHNVCMKSSMWTSCKGAVDYSGCHGDHCACCRKGECEATKTCTDNHGYCFHKHSNHKCYGTVVHKGCTGYNCACCM